MKMVKPENWLLYEDYCEWLALQKEKQMDNLTATQIFDAIYSAKDSNDILDLWQSYCDDNQFKDQHVYKMEHINDILEGMKPLDIIDLVNYLGFKSRDIYFTIGARGLISFSDLHGIFSPIDFYNLADWIIERYQAEFLAHYKHLLSIH